MIQREATGASISNSVFILRLFIILFLPVLLGSCTHYKRNSTHKHVSLASIQNGKALAIKFCQSCHLLPDPSMLDSKSWEKGVLPNMGPRLGIFNNGFHAYPSSKMDKNLDPGYYPSMPVLAFGDWQNILDYYEATSPDSLPGQDRHQPISVNLPLFVPKPMSFTYKNPATVFVKINDRDTSQPLVVSDALKQEVYFLNRIGEIRDSMYSPGPVVNIDFEKDRMLWCNIGVLPPNDGRFGTGELITIGANGEKTRDTIPAFDGLRRPVQISAADLNDDGRTDYLVCEFGNLMGSLSWMEDTGNGKFSKHVLRAAPGSIKAYVNDYNHDGLPDIWALFAQGEEGIFLFTNKGHGEFRTQEVLRFPPVYGSSYFELADFNNDGYPDIVYTCGDNADFSPVLKPYHGVYIFLNDKSNHFTQKYFFPINGCYKAVARDFDGDGDLDIATISFFADYERQPEESFVYLENKGDFNFQPYSLPAAKEGRWLTMDAGDIDGDGKIDLILGNFSLGLSLVRPSVDWKKSPPFIVLKNTGKVK